LLRYDLAHPTKGGNQDATTNCTSAPHRRKKGADNATLEGFRLTWVRQITVCTSDRFFRPKGDMTMDKIPLTKAGFDKLDAELKHLKSVERPLIIRAISEAREHGDLSENAEYHSAKEKQSFIEGRVKELEGVISLAEVINTAKLSGTIKFGAHVELVDEDTDEEKAYQVVGEYEADIEGGRLNIKSPLARALIGKDTGDSVEVRTPGGQKSYEILSITFK
jgi:transcription elongation factor GreA